MARKRLQDITITQITDLLDHNLVEQDGECLLWTRYMDNGVPTIKVDGKRTKARQLLWSQLGIEANQRARMTCGNKACMNPDHLEPIKPPEITRIAEQLYLIRQSAMSKASLSEQQIRGHEQTLGRLEREAKGLENDHPEHVGDLLRYINEDRRLLRQQKTGNKLAAMKKAQKQ